MCSIDLHIVEMNKKKILSTKSINFGEYINNVFFHKQIAHIVTQKTIHRVNLTSL
jgi:hypothetical protein